MSIKSLSQNNICNQTQKVRQNQIMMFRATGNVQLYVSDHLWHTEILEIIELNIYVLIQFCYIL